MLAPSRRVSSARHRYAHVDPAAAVLVQFRTGPRAGRVWLVERSEVDRIDPAGVADGEHRDAAAQVRAALEGQDRRMAGRDRAPEGHPYRVSPTGGSPASAPGCRRCTWRLTKRSSRRCSILDLLGAVSFDKGCYTGQEIIARTYLRGSIKRRMFRFECAGLPPAPYESARRRAACGRCGRCSGHEMGEPLAVISLAQQDAELELESNRGVRLKNCRCPACWTDCRAKARPTANYHTVGSWAVGRALARQSVPSHSWSHVREQQHIADRRRVRQQHHQPIDADAQPPPAACRIPARECNPRRTASPPGRRPACAPAVP